MSSPETDITSGLSGQRAFARKLEKIVFFGLLGTFLLLAITPANVDSPSKWLFVVTISIWAGLRFLEGVLRAPFSLSEPLLLAPLFGILLLSILQILPFDSWSSSFEAQRTISLDEFETRKFIVIYSGLLLTFEVLLRYTVTRARLLALICSVLAIGAGSALFGLFRQLISENATSGVSSLVNLQPHYAQFANRNHFALLIEMCIGLLWGLLLKGKMQVSLKLFGCILMALFFLAIISANSRGGIITTLGLGVMALFAHLFTQKKPSSRRTRTETKFSGLMRYLKTGFAALILSVLLLGASVLTIVLIGGDTVMRRIETLNSELDPDGNHRIRRREIWGSTLELIKEHPVAGVGFGAYPAAITKYDTSPGYFKLEQAHNDYLEVLANGGLPALLLVLIFLIVVLKKAVRQLAAKDYLRQGTCFGAMLGITGVLIHSMFDFGMQVPINTIVFMILVTIATRPMVKAEES